MRVLFDTRYRDEEVGMQVYTNCICQYLAPYHRQHELSILSGHPNLESQVRYFVQRNITWPQDRILLDPCNSNVSSIPHFLRYLHAHRTDIFNIGNEEFCLHALRDKQLNDLAPEIIHHHEYINDAFVDLKAVQVTTVHDLYCYRINEDYSTPSERQHFLDFVIPTIKHRMDFIITVSERSRQDICEILHWPEDRIKTILEAPRDIARVPMPKEAILAAQRHLGLPERYVFGLSTVSQRHKNFLRLIQAFHAVIQDTRDPDLALVVTGSGVRTSTNSPALDYISRHALKSRVFFTDYLPDALLFPIMCGAQVFCMPSLYEGFGLPAAEALAMGVPLCLANNASLPEVAGKAARYFNPYTVTDIATALHDTLYHGPTLARLRQHQPAELAKLSWEKHAKELISTYEMLI